MAATVRIGGASAIKSVLHGGGGAAARHAGGVMDAIVPSAISSSLNPSGASKIANAIDLSRPMPMPDASGLGAGRGIRDARPRPVTPNPGPMPMPSAPEITRGVGGPGAAPGPIGFSVGGSRPVVAGSTGGTVSSARVHGPNQALTVPASMRNLPSAPGPRPGITVPEFHGPSRALGVPASMRNLPSAPGPRGGMGSGAARGMGMMMGIGIGAAGGGMTSWLTGGNVGQGALAGAIVGGGMGAGHAYMGRGLRQANVASGRQFGKSGFSTNLARLGKGMESASSRAMLFGGGGMLGGFMFGGNKSHKRGFNSRRGNSIGR